MLRLGKYWPAPSAGGAQMPAERRGRLAHWVALATVVSLSIIFVLSTGTQFLMPGPLNGAHASIESCSSCHAASGSGKLSWLKGLGKREPHADSKACLTCHTMPNTAFNAHGAADDVLRRSTERLTKTAAALSSPITARAQNFAFPTHDMVASGLQCATCHQEHKGSAFDPKLVANEQCRSCHIVKFDSFDKGHPVFETYPFRRRTRLIYDHAAHFGKHFPEVAKKDSTKTIPATCATCHDKSADKRIMGIASFDKTCRTCHLDQITGKERASGPKGVPFLALPGIDVASLKSKNAAIGEWPQDSDATLTPFMKVMIGRTAQGQAVLDAVDRLNLQDLTSASEAEIKAVANLVWEIKALFNALVSGQASEIFAGLEFASGREAASNIVADLTASLPRDVLVSAQRTWLPNLTKEMAGADARERQRSDLDPVTSSFVRLAHAETQIRSDADPLRVFLERRSGSIQLAEGDSHGEDTIKRRVLPSGTPRAIRGETIDGESQPRSLSKGTGRSVIPSLDDPITLPDAAGATDAGGGAPPSNSDPADQSDELLKPTEAELKEIKAREKGARPAPSGGGPAIATPSPGGAAPPPGQGQNSAAEATLPASDTPDAAPEDGDVDAEEWAQAGGWYRQDYAIYYRPIGHKDRFLASWLQLTGPRAPRDDKGPASSVFNFLTGKDAQGSCAKCHSVDDVPGKGRVVNFAPATVQSKAGQFTRFMHEPHFGLMGDRGCLGCHALEKGQSPLKSYEQGDPRLFVSNFANIKKDTCQSCHASGVARQDCSLCHVYHVNGSATAIMKTKIPTP
jgi:hypothetical protein